MDLVTVSRVRRAFRDGRAAAWRVEAGLSLRELAGMVEVSHSTLGRWEAGTSAPSPDAAIRWAEAMRRLGFEV